jgi:hypothetical protein
MQAPPKIASNIPKMRGQPMPDASLDVCQSWAVAGEEWERVIARLCSTSFRPLDAHIGAR